jgi:hypothetical protein
MTPKIYKSSNSLNSDLIQTGWNRISVVNSALAMINPRGKYLEIGCAYNDLFNSVITNDKVGVDPALGGTLRMTSDDFFQQNKDFFDVIFIDGFHTYEQVKKDAINSASHLTKEGVILFHDFLPLDWMAAIPNDLPQVQARWNGDCYKFAFELLKLGIQFKIVAIDHGILFIYGSENISALSNVEKKPIKKFKDLAFDYYLNHISSLPIISYADFLNILEELKDETKNAQSFGQTL